GAIIQQAAPDGKAGDDHHAEEERESPEVEAGGGLTASQHTGSDHENGAEEPGGGPVELAGGILTGEDDEVSEGEDCEREELFVVHSAAILRTPPAALLRR